MKCKHCGTDIFQHERDYYGLEICANCADNMPGSNAHDVAELEAEVKKLRKVLGNIVIADDALSGEGE